jgi:hypothetical protein
MANPQFGFMTIVHESNGYVGGYLVTNTWGRPLEFRLSTAVQPNRIQQILYGQALQPYVFADLIGKALFERTATRPQLVLADRAPLLSLRPHVDVPMVYLPQENAPSRSESSDCAFIISTADGSSAAFCHSGFAADRELARTLLDRLRDNIDVNEPFGRIRDAVSEARKMGATARA